MTLLALGTDLPEIANSIVASYTDNGDINVGDSIGSSIPQLALVLGLLPFAGFVIALGEHRSRLLKGQQTTAWLTAAALLGVAALLMDDHLGRIDAAILIATGIAGSRLVYGRTRTDPQLDLIEHVGSRTRIVGRLTLAFIAIGTGATLAMNGIIELAEIWGVPAFFVAIFRGLGRDVAAGRNHRLHRTPTRRERSRRGGCTRVLIRRCNSVDLDPATAVPNRHRRRYRFQSCTDHGRGGHGRRPPLGSWCHPWAAGRSNPAARLRRELGSASLSSRLGR